MNTRIPKMPIVLVVLLSMASCLSAQVDLMRTDRQTLVFCTVKATDSRPDTICLSGGKGAGKIEFLITGDMAANFKLVSPKLTMLAAGQKIKGVLIFSPAADLVGLIRAKLLIRNAVGKTLNETDLRGLSLNGLEGANEPPLATVFDALGYRVDPGWSGLAHNLLPERAGDEIYASSFRKAGKGNVDIQAVARFSPDYELPFGYCTYSRQGPELHEVAVLAKTITTPQHQTLFPELSAGARSFDPGTMTFGLYTRSTTHTSYTSDDWNLLNSPGHAGHAARIYPAKDQNGKLLANTYIVCFEEAQNGDYQDYVFVLKNVRPVAEEEEYTVLLNGRDLNGWDLFLEKTGVNNDSTHNFSVADGVVHVRGEYLGYLRTRASFADYHFKVEFKWGEKRWPPREEAKRDAGICYNIPDDEPDSIWPRSIECQIQEGDVGDFWLLSGSTIEVDGKRNIPSNHTRVVKKKDAERPTGEWNTVEVISYHGSCIQIVNGVVVNDGDHASVEKGRILLQSEFSEVYYRNARIAPIVRGNPEEK